MDTYASFSCTCLQSFGQNEDAYTLDPILTHRSLLLNF